MGSAASFPITALRFAPSGAIASKPGRPSAEHFCHQPAVALTTRGSRFFLNRARARVSPCGVARRIQSPSAMPRAVAVSG